MIDDAVSNNAERQEISDKKDQRNSSLNQKTNQVGQSIFWPCFEKQLNEIQNGFLKKLLPKKKTTVLIKSY